MNPKEAIEVLNYLHETGYAILVVEPYDTVAPAIFILDGHPNDRRVNKKMQEWLKEYEYIHGECRARYYEKYMVLPEADMQCLTVLQLKDIIRNTKIHLGLETILGQMSLFKEGEN